ncbi:hypothetical protein [Pandoravirus japonicus]|uniref:Uncharacterized protein n=1 Tax=Pandoravirus japonicus TaxID=2823154 RepID=A0A811BN32_9VIRU|nr:hypothetical protein [Pandoravirus japonicus]
MGRSASERSGDLRVPTFFFSLAPSAAVGTPSCHWWTLKKDARPKKKRDHEARCTARTKESAGPHTKHQNKTPPHPWA